MRILIIDFRDSYTWNLLDLVLSLGVHAEVRSYDSVVEESILSAEVQGNISATDLKQSFGLPDLLSQFEAIILSPGPGEPQDYIHVPDILRAAEATDLPILGVCLGHQLLLEHHCGSLGGKSKSKSQLESGHSDPLVTRQQPAHGLLSEIKVLFGEKPREHLFFGIPPKFHVVRYHSLAANIGALRERIEALNLSDRAVVPVLNEQQTLLNGGLGDPDGVKKTDILSDPETVSTCPETVDSGRENDTGTDAAYSSSLADIHVLATWEQLVMAVEFVMQRGKDSSYSRFGLQFHPESICTEYGAVLVSNFIRQVGRMMCRNELHKSLPEISNSRTMANAFSLASQKREFHVHSCHFPTASSFDAEQFFGEYFSADDPHRTAFLLDGARFAYMGGSGFTRLVEKFCQRYGLNREALYPDITVQYDLRNRKVRVAEVFPFGCTKQSVEPNCRDDVDFESTNRIGTATLQGKDMFLKWFSRNQGKWNSGISAKTSIPFPFRGGSVGYLSYDMKEETLERTSENDRHVSYPDAYFFFPSEYVVIDNAEKKIYHVSKRIRSGASKNAGMGHFLEKLIAGDLKESGCDRTVSSEPKVTTPEANQTSPSIPGHLKCRIPEETYRKKVEECIEYMRSGESYELCLTTQWELELEAKEKFLPCEVFSLYKVLRRKNPAPYASFVRVPFIPIEGSNCPPEDLSAYATVLCSSPERFMQVSPNDHNVTPSVPSSLPDLTIECKPIKGTVRRDKSDNAKDEELKRFLEEDTKNRAENLMIVDLVRNDFSKICSPGSVHVPKLMEVESYETVHQLVSTVRGKISLESPSANLAGYYFSNASVASTDSANCGRQYTADSQLSLYESGIGSALESVNLGRGVTESVTESVKTCVSPPQAVLAAIAASFPPGSMTGAPKKRSCELLESLEDFKPRGIYSGCLGFLSADGGADLSVVIRTMVAECAATSSSERETEYLRRLTLNAGGAVTVLSDPQDEFGEMVLKTRATGTAIAEFFSSGGNSVEKHSRSKRTIEGDASDTPMSEEGLPRDGAEEKSKEQKLRKRKQVETKEQEARRALARKIMPAGWTLQADIEIEASTNSSSSSSTAVARTKNDTTRLDSGAIDMVFTTLCFDSRKLNHDEGKNAQESGGASRATIFADDHVARLREACSSVLGIECPFRDAQALDKTLTDRYLDFRKRMSATPADDENTNLAGPAAAEHGKPLSPQTWDEITRVKVAIYRSGEVEIQSAPLATGPGSILVGGMVTDLSLFGSSSSSCHLLNDSERQIPQVFVDFIPTQSDCIQCLYKTGDRRPYMQNVTRVQRQLAKLLETRKDLEMNPHSITDVLLHNTRGEITESTIANFAVEISPKHWITPPIKSGLLEGVMRKNLMRRYGERNVQKESNDHVLEERVVTWSDFYHLIIEERKRVVLFNSLRGVWEVRVRFLVEFL